MNHEAWVEQQRQRSAVAQQAQELARSCSAAVTNLLFAMASASARQEPRFFLALGFVCYMFCVLCVYACVFFVICCDVRAVVIDRCHQHPLCHIQRLC